MTSSTILEGHFQIADDRIDALAFTVCDTSDNRWCDLKLHADHETADLCPVRALLIYLYLVGWKDGYIFPTSEELQNPPMDGIYTTHIDHQLYLDALKEKCEATLPSRTPELKIGRQIFRKTFYVLAVFGKAGEFDLKQSARHKRGQNSLKYRKAAMEEYDIHKIRPAETNVVSKWKPIWIDRTSGNTTLLASMGGYKTMSIADVPAFFVHEILGVTKWSPGAVNKQYLIDKATRYVPVDSPEDKLAALMARMPVEDSTLLKNILPCFVAAHIKQMIAKKDADPALLAAVADTCSPAEPRIQSAAASPADFHSSLAVPVTLQKRKQCDEVFERNDLDGREKVKDLKNARLKLEEMIRLAKVKKESPVPLTGKAKTWASRYLTPVMGCLEHHFANNPEQFLASYPEYHPNSFPTKHCKGKSTSHCLC